MPVGRKLGGVVNQGGFVRYTFNIPVANTGTTATLTLNVDSHTTSWLTTSTRVTPNVYGWYLYGYQYTVGGTAPSVALRKNGVSLTTTAFVDAVLMNGSSDYFEVYVTSGTPSSSANGSFWVLKIWGA